MTQRGFTELLSADRTHQDQLRELQDLEQRMAIEQAKGNADGTPWPLSRKR
jgi:hypothetical protein